MLENATILVQSSGCSTIDLLKEKRKCSIFSGPSFFADFCNFNPICNGVTPNSLFPIKRSPNCRLSLFSPKIRVQGAFVIMVLFGEKTLNSLELVYFSG